MYYVDRWFDVSCSLTHTLVLIPNSDKKHKHVNATQSGQTDMTFRHIRRTGASLTTTGLLPDGNRLIITYPNQEQDSRLVNNPNPKKCEIRLKHNTLSMFP